MATPEFEKQISQGDEAVRRGDLEAAKQFYEQARSTEPENLDATVGLDYVAFLKASRPSRYHFANREQLADLSRKKGENARLIEEGVSSGGRLGFGPFRAAASSSTPLAAITTARIAAKAAWPTRQRTSQATYSNAPLKACFPA